MLLALSSYHYIIVFSTTIIISYFFTLYAKKSGIPSVLMLIGLGFFINYLLLFLGVEKPDLLPILEVIGVVGLILIVLEAALDLRLEKEKTGLIITSFLVAFLGLSATSYVCSLVLVSLLEISFIKALLYSIPLSILSSAIILPSIEDLDQKKKEFMIYESTFSDILGIVAFYAVITMSGSDSGSGVYGEVFGNLALTVIFSFIFSYILIYLFQKMTGHVKLFLLIAVLLLLYAVGKMFHLSSLIIILIFGVILNNSRLFFRGGVSKLVVFEKIESVLEGMKVVTAETAFVVRTFFFIIFGWSVYLGSLFDLNVLFLGFLFLCIIYIIRAFFLFLFQGKNIFPQLFLAPRGLITILLFFAIPQHLSIGEEGEGILLLIVLTSCLIMSWSLVKQKSLSEKTEDNENILTEDSEINTDLENLEE